MSSFARKQLEKFGWTDGDGLGKNRDGMSTFVKAVKPKGERGDCFGIGHDATKGTRNSDMGFGSVLQEIGGKTKKKSKKTAAETSDNDEEDNQSSSASSSSSQEPEEKPSRKKQRVETPADSDSDVAAPKKKKAVTEKKTRQAADSSDSDSSDSDSDSSDSDNGDGVLDWNDAKLFERCGGVRLGRGGRHRFFDGKLARIEKNNTSKEGEDPYKIKAKEGEQKKKKRNDFA